MNENFWINITKPGLFYVIEIWQAGEDRILYVEKKRCQEVYNKPYLFYIHKGEILTNEELLQNILNSTIQRFGKQASAYEAEIANLLGQVIVLNEQVKELTEGKSKTKNAN